MMYTLSMEQINTPSGWLEEEVKRGEWIDAKKSGKPFPTKEQWSEIRKLNAEKDAHSEFCPMGQVGKISTLCVCEVLAKAKQPEECMRCHQLADDCKCGSKAQLV